MWGRRTYLSLMLHWVRHPAKEQLRPKLINQLINETLRQSPRVMPDQMIGMLIFLWNLFNKQRQFNQKYVNLLKPPNHPPEYYNLENTNNGRKWNVIRRKDGRPKPDLLIPIYLKPRMITLHVSQKQKCLTIYHDPIDTPCQL